uniref:Aminotransferase-like plant mobile domain-containing protein n=1 Tax=Oryza rufipogon TaxID=4529 RepID=A0A0E0MWB2_ORYRU
MGRENKRPNPSGSQAKKKQTIKGRSTQHVNPCNYALAVVIDLEKEHNATSSQQNPVRYSNSERPQRGRRDAETTVDLPEGVQPLNTDEAEKTDDFMSKVASCLNIKRGSQLISQAEKDLLTRSCDWGRFRVPTPYNQLSLRLSNLLLGSQYQPGDEPEAGVYDLPRHIATLAQQFINSTTKRWVEDSAYLKKAGIFRGVMASIYKCQINPVLVAAFLTYWNVDGYTLITSQGGMGYPLHTMYDAIGHTNFWTPTLHNIYADECPLQLNEGPGLVTIATWVNHFFGNDPVSIQSFLPDGFVDPTKPLYEDRGFHVELRNDRPTAIMCDLKMSYVYTYPLVVYRATFIAAWLCTYCVPVEEGKFIRPEVFAMAVEIAQGSRRAIGITSMAFLYRALNNIHHYVAARKALATSLSCPVLDPPCIVDFRNYRSMDFKSEHELFWDFNQDGSGLRSLDFLGRSGIRFQTVNQEFEMFDNRAFMCNG